MFIVPNLEEIRASLLRDYQTYYPNADTSEDSDAYARASSLAACAEGIYAHQKWLIKQFFPDTADTEFLEKHAGLRGLRRRNATYAAGKGATVSGNPDAVIAVGLQIKTEDGRFYETTESAVIPASGSVIVAVRSLATGAAQNIKTATKGSFMAAPVGVSTDVVLNDVVGATNAESDSSLLERLLNKIRRPAAGGNKYDYKDWALEVDGVEQAYVYPLRRGLGTVDIAITADNGVPSDDTVRRAQEYIDQERPVTAKESKVVKPDVTKINFNIQVKISGVALNDIKIAISNALTDYFNGLIPGDDLIVSQCEAVVSDLIGVVDRRFIAPNANRKADVINKIEWFRLGEITVTEMA
ncbi:baseplate J/gp47 family protein [Haemophilus parainfluenzae]|uniref:Baseplate J/gp47 family protein n=1 Tax=Haemophilus parainfluenzae TaxID=729 RepID=A0AAQ0H0A8_HAEPA|nr:baseplate J/gp47 family protein [Haemophilus parainfluenzae]RDE84903.1 baseplate J/gp47 family protein [Haemophilus parainfluenzae]